MGGQRKMEKASSQDESHWQKFLDYMKLSVAVHTHTQCI